MMYSTNMQIIMFKYFVFQARKKCQKCDVSMHVFKPPNFTNFLFIFVSILHVLGYISDYAQIFFIFSETCNYDFILFKMKGSLELDGKGTFHLY
jgi:hypothetical protein